MRKLLKYILLTPFALAIVWLTYLNLQLHHHPKIAHENDSVINQDVLYQLQYLDQKIDQGAAHEMQNLFPEGFIFLHSLYVLAWSDIATDMSQESEHFATAIQEMDQSLGRMQSADGKRVFPESMDFQYGAFYNGWLTYSVGSRLLLQSDSLLELRFQQHCKQIAAAYRNNDYQYLESYRDAIWAADNMVCLASLRRHDELYLSQYEGVVDSCLIQIKANLVEETGLIPHSSSTATNQSLEGARGSSQSLILNFLIEIDSSFAITQFDIYKELFLDRRLGLYGIREYPKGTRGEGDIDSGPVIWDIGGAASIVGMRTFMRYGEVEIARSLQNSVEAFGVSLRWNGRKRYLLGALPMADAFIAWGNGLNQRQSVKVNFPKWRFHLLSLLLILLLGSLIFWIFKWN